MLLRPCEGKTARGDRLDNRSSEGLRGRYQHRRPVRCRATSSTSERSSERSQSRKLAPEGVYSNNVVQSHSKRKVPLSSLGHQQKRVKVAVDLDEGMLARSFGNTLVGGQAPY